MATKPESVTSWKYLGVDDVMKITGYQLDKAYKTIQQMNKILKAQNKITFRGKIREDHFYELS